MTQEIVYRSPEGIVMASDSLIVHAREDGRREYRTARKLFPVGPWAALVTAGAFVGVRISQDFAAQAEGPAYMAQLAPAAQSYFEQAYGRFIEENAAWFSAHPEAHRSLYLLLAGRSGPDEDSWTALFLSSEDHRLPFQVSPIGEVLTVPRRLGLEGQLVLRLKHASPLEDVANYCHQALTILAERDPGQAGLPFYTAILDDRGFRWWQRPAEEAP